MGSTPRGISGSRGAAVLGLSEWATPLQVWQEIMEERKPGFNAARGYELPPAVDNAAVRWGTAFEDAICRLAVERHGAGTIVGREELWTTNGTERTSPGQPGDGLPWFITCHIDGRYTEGGALHEGKTTTSWNFAELWGEPGTDRIPQNYQLQVQHQMLCTGAPAAIVSLLVWPRRVEEWEAAGIVPEVHPGPTDAPEWHLAIPRRPPDTGHFARTCFHWAMILDEMGWFQQYHVPAAPSLQAELVRAYTEWWEEYVVGEREPEARTYDDIRRLVPAPKGTVVADEQAERWAREYAEIGAEIGGTGRLAKRRDELKLLILMWMRSRDAAMDDESREKTVLRDAAGKKLASWDRKAFRT